MTDFLVTLLQAGLLGLTTIALCAFGDWICEGQWTAWIADRIRGENLGNNKE